MTKEEIINRLDCCIGRKADCKNCPMNGEDLCAEKLYRETIRLLKENEPASAGTDTSSKCNELQSNNTMKLKICQEIAKNLITIQDDQMGDIYTSGYVQAMREILMILDRF